MYKKNYTFINITFFKCIFLLLLLLNSSEFDVFTYMSNSPPVFSLYFCFPRDYDSLRKEDVFENNSLVRWQDVESLLY